MSKIIGQLLGSDQRTLDEIIRRLEHVTLQASTDVRLTAEIITSAREKARALGLDPSDTTTEELYHGLIARAGKDAQALRSKLGIDDATTPVKAAAVIAEKTEKLLKKEKVICLQPAAVKKILKAVPPKRTMKALHFRSVDAVLKRENPLVLYALAKRLEEKTWHSQVQARLKRLQPRDGRECSVQVLSLPQKWLEKLEKHEFDNVVQPVAEIGSVLILPSVPLEIPGSVLLTTAIVLQAGQKLAIESLPYRTRSLTTGIEKLLPDVAAGLLNELEPVHGLLPSWQAVYQLLSERGKNGLPDFEFVLGELFWESTEVKLSALCPELDFWVNTHYLGFVSEPRPISMHIVDIAASLVLKRDFGDQVVTHLRSSLWNELQLRYLKNEAMERAIIAQLTIAQDLVL